MPDVMRAAVLRAPHVVEVAEVPVPTITNPTDVLVRVEQTAICGTDLHPYEGRLEVEPDIVLGHEFLGTVVAAGDAVGQLSVGDRVVSSCVVSCGSCYQCRRHQPGNCAGSRIFGLGLALGDLMGGQAEYVAVPNADLTARRVPDAGIDEDILFAGDIMTTGYEAVARAMRPGDTVAVVGAGPVGLCAAMAATALGAAQVIVVDKVDTRLKEAANHGAITVDAGQVEPADVVLDLTDWRGADVVVDAVGHESALLSAISLVRAGGTLSIPGVYTEDAITIPFGELYLKGITLEMGVSHITEYMDEVIALTVAGKLTPSSIISHRMGLSQAAEAYRMFEAREATKIILDPAI
ncbi:2-desacetyl-2-hydroxyethyl bacteriochlorophyllide A dehydrogenase [Mycolicibacterium sp. BK556]|uniref:alcohol dehydrogenase catalytic domain-containing protein n=1 Tax=unclassified Mycolicibacterium TaxID=2636767 RepID=UPI0018544CFA|nr:MULTISPECIES: alcohol dehydrogenase catalytic domain-containing protein [unclassified Mycolicibacterium]MBB3601892.1 2-desacetyl-2-hydroxyethyl bacteriochlorophyllide A dehydrogenase [Mycolicibacterium sp. BK556]MBB3631644.1 2-desacetyl-2-hydroxyethyl bacteriochlorophyllide A dehydrogenase [Mycolicibacterium sp. BK607]